MVTAVTSAKNGLKYYRAPGNVVRRIVAKRTIKNALILSVILIVYMLSKGDGYIKAYPTAVSRQKIADSLGSNVGIKALLGAPHNIETVAGYACWNFLCIIMAAGAIWALLLATKTFRGEEDSGRWELMLAGQTTARRAAVNAATGLLSGLTVLYVLITLGVYVVSKLPGAFFTTSGIFFFSLALTCGAAEFLAIGFLASQLMPVRSRATGLSAIIFGVFYMMRLIADTTSAHWLLDVSPLGWIEKLQPTYGSKPLWLLPIGAFIIVVSGLAIYYAGHRDLGEAVFADKDSAKARTGLLGSPLGLALRLNWVVSVVWLVLAAVIAYLFGVLAKGASQAFAGSTASGKVLKRLADSSNTASTAEFMGVTFLFVMLLVMFYAASAVVRMREEEAQGYLDNLLVRKVSRLRWLSGRALIVLVIICLSGLFSGVAAWIGQASQDGGLALSSLVAAGINAMAPILVILGLGIFALGLKPRLTSAIIYGYIAWSFLVVLLGSGLNINHWLLDSSILHQVTLAPAVNPDWTTNSLLLIIGAVLAVFGAWAFNRRDLANE
jgi:ABC-2 type transport system permease protein